LGGDKNYDTQEFVRELRGVNITPHVAQNGTNRPSAIDQRTLRQAMKWASRNEKRVEQSLRRRAFQRFVVPKQGIWAWNQS
jgi:hypothetical protein